jgi:hypothetical protein
VVRATGLEIKGVSSLLDVAFIVTGAGEEIAWELQTTL